MCIEKLKLINIHIYYMSCVPMYVYIHIHIHIGITVKLDIMSDTDGLTKYIRYECVTKFFTGKV